jgi:hypothetical protein
MRMLSGWIGLGLLLATVANCVDSLNRVHRQGESNHMFKIFLPKANNSKMIQFFF